MKRKPLSQDFARIGTDWRPAMVRIGRTQGTGCILEVTLVDGEDEGKMVEARKLPRKCRRTTAYNRLKARRLRKANRIQCPSCHKLMGKDSTFCPSCASSRSNRIRHWPMTEAEIMFGIMVEKGEP